MKSSHLIPLADVATISNERIEPLDYPEKYFNYLGLENIESHTGHLLSVSPTQGFQIRSTKNVFHPGQILYGKLRPYLNKVHLATHEGICSTDIFVLVAKTEKVLPSFLAYFLRSSIVLSKVENLMQGANLPRISQESLLGIQIPLPPLTEQQRIVCLLDEAEALRKLRAQAGARMAQFIPALFHEMFGDPAINEKNWKIDPLVNLTIKFSDGPFGSNLKTSHYVSNGVRVVRLQNIGVGEYVDDDKAYISDAHFHTLNKHECLPGDVIAGTMGNPNLRACILPDYIPIALNKADCPQIRPNPKSATAEYICWLLNMPSTLELASGLIQGQTRARISMGRLRELKVPIPPLPLQQEFAQRVQEAREIQSRQARSAERIEALYQSMLSRAFAGEL